jgi:hypothetical protein
MERCEGGGRSSARRGSLLKPRLKLAAFRTLRFVKGSGLDFSPASKTTPPAPNPPQKLTALKSLYSSSQLPIIVAMKICFTTDAPHGRHHSRPQHPSVCDLYFAHFASAEKRSFSCH